MPAAVCLCKTKATDSAAITVLNLGGMHFTFRLFVHTRHNQHHTLKHIFTLFVFFVAAHAAHSQGLQSPAQFLGYELGTRYTPHHRIVDYFKYLDEASDMVALQQYGETNEHRPLLVAFIGTAANVAGRERIRENNLRLANQGSDNTAGNEATPAVVWLSYNVHGNETSSSEAAMGTAYALLTNKKDYLENTLVVMDPCMNPDGRDRYVNWYTIATGKFINPNPIAREHREPWPQGRSNHYNFDLNRDWAWQTQVESQQRLRLYNTWLPQVHVDFHEQGINSPYYFAPAAEPFHEIITPWQREFQNTIGKNHARYFDQNGWLYFTKERFDLLYPSYGDTYPIYNGSIGMTYEQGGIGAGLAERVAEGDTLTLVDRVAHHTTTGLSTVEVANKNASQLVSNFKKYFADAVQGKTGRYKTFVVKYSPENEQRIAALKSLLLKNNIRFGSASGSANGYNYFNKRNENFSIAANDLVISAKQPKAALVQVLFEPQTRLSDSVTYDITAWSMPYCYGVNAYASTQDVSVRPYPEPDSVRNPVADPYAYVLPWGGMNAAKTAIQLMQKGVRVRFNEAAFTSGKTSFGPGSIIIAKNGNGQVSNLWSLVRQTADANNVKLYQAGSGMVDAGMDFGSGSVVALKKPRVYLLTGDGVSAYGAGEVWSFFDNELQYPLTQVNLRDFESLNLNAVDVLIMPEGRYPFLSNKAAADKLTGWINGGGKLIAMDGAVPQLARQEWAGIKLKNEADTTDSDEIKLSNFAGRERDFLRDFTPGAIFKVAVDNTHPLFYGYPNYYYTLKMDGNVFGPIAGGYNAGILDKDNLMAGFVGADLKKKLKSGVVFGVKPMGSGQIIYLTDDVLFRNFWENGKLLFTNAVFLVGSQWLDVD